MKVVIWDFKDTGALGVVLGDKAFVDASYLEDFMKEHPEAEMEGVNTEKSASLAASV